MLPRFYSFRVGAIGKRVPEMNRSFSSGKGLAYSLVNNHANRNMLLLHGIMGNRRNWGDFVKLYSMLCCPHLQTEHASSRLECVSR